MLVNFGSQEDLQRDRDRQTCPFAEPVAYVRHQGDLVWDATKPFGGS
jgi:hypothetical protein